MLLDDFDYFLPEERIAQVPLEQRDMSRLMVLDRTKNTISHRSFRNILEYLRPNDVLVINDTRVFPARLYGQRITGAKIETLFLRNMGDDTWECLVKPGNKVPVGDVIIFANGQMTGTVLEKTMSGGRVIKFETDSSVDRIVEEFGEMPLPHYIKHKLDNPERYQTVYGKNRGSVAAPTAGLHFTPDLLLQIENMGVKIARLTLHVGLGTFRPVKVENIEDHVMHSEYYVVTKECADIVNEAKRNNGRVIAVGTTAVRTLETVAAFGEDFKECSGWTDIFIYPGYEFKIVDGIMTNFHLPKSTLLMLVSAFAGRAFVLEAYKKAVEEKYRFFSFGDSMLIL